MQNIVFGATLLVDNNGVDGMYFLKTNNGHGMEVVVQVVNMVQVAVVMVVDGMVVAMVLVQAAGKGVQAAAMAMAGAGAGP